ncbi:MAG: GGDEF domain-containing protein [Hydrogenimonas sp.]|nr:GGDEF domain-containing protein [Hydrogenimonas sp.]
MVDGSGNIQMSNLAYKNLCMRIDCDGIDSICSFIAAIDKKGAFRGSGSKNNLLKYLVQMDGEIVEFDLDGKTQYLELHVRQIDDLHLLEFHDVTAFKNEAKELERESLIDQLTNAYNRKIFKRATAKIAKSGSSMCVIMIDIDHFKRVNDTFGHGVGDEVLKMVAKEIKNNIRSEDYFIRWGGEEFMLLSSTNRDSGYLIAEKIRKAIESIDFERVGKVTVSCGVSCKETKAIDSFDKLVEEADMALYQAKKEGRNKVVCKS